MSENVPRPPGHLTSATKQWFKQVASTYSLEAHQVRLLILASEAWDRGQKAREAVKKYGLVYTDRYGQPKERPEAATERLSATVFSRMVKALNLDEDAGPKRPTWSRT